MILPHCDDLFLKFFDPWYDDQDRARRGHPATRPDLVRYDGLVGRRVEDLATLSEDGRKDVLARINRMTEAARNDWSELLLETEETGLAWLASIDAHYDRERIQEIIDQSDADDYANSYLVTCCEFGAVLGHTMKTLMPRLEWHRGWPYWESALFDSETGTLIPVFHWAVKKMSEYGIDDGFAGKVEVCIGILETGTES